MQQRRQPLSLAGMLAVRERVQQAAHYVMNVVVWWHTGKLPYGDCFGGFVLMTRLWSTGSGILVPQIMLLPLNMQQIVCMCVMT